MKRASKIHSDLSSLLAELPPEGVQLVELFARFLREQTRQGLRIGKSAAQDQVLYLYPTVHVPISLLDGLIGIMPPVGGNALKDSEALYDGM